MKTRMCKKRDRGKSFQHIYLRPIFEKKNWECGVQSVPPLCSEPNTPINFPKIWVRKKYVESFEVKYQYWVSCQGYVTFHGRFIALRAFRISYGSTS